MYFFETNYIYWRQKDAIMNYIKIYDKIIEKAKSENRKLKCGIYYEKHHIKPRSLFKDLIKDPDNIVLLTAKEHFICHMLLDRIYDCYQMKYAIWRMCNDSKYKVSAKFYEYIKQKIAIEASKLNKGKKLSDEVKRKISLGLSGKTHSEETKRKMRESWDASKHVLSEEGRKKLSENASKRFKGKKKTDDFRNHLSEIRKGEGNPMFGKPNKLFMSDEKYEEYKKSLSESLKGHSVSEETREKIRQKTKARVQGENNPRAKKVKIVELNKTFGTIKQCCDFLGVDRNTIAKNKEGDVSKVKGYQIIFVDDGA